MMSAIVQRSGCKRKQDDLSLQAKRPKLETRLSDLNFDCLEKIFNLLEMASLLSIAQVNAQFSGLAAPLIKKKQEPIAFRNVNYFIGNRIQPGQWNYLFKDKLIKDHNLGSSITKLLLDTRITSWLRVDNIVKYCSELKELHIEYCSKFLFTNIDEPFEKLEVLTVNDGILGPKLSQLSKWFPRLEDVSLNCVVDDESAILQNLEVSTATLKGMSLSLRKKSSSTVLNIDAVIKSNPQLEKICLNEWGFGCRPRDLRVVNKFVDDLEELKVFIRFNNFQTNSVRTIKFKSVKKFVLMIGINFVHKLRNHIPCPCPFDFFRLEDLEIGCQYREEDWFFFAKSSHLKKLNFHSLGFDPDMDFLLKISRTWPHLTEVTIYTDATHNLWITEILQFMESLRRLERLNILKQFRFSGGIETLREEVPSNFRVISEDGDRISIVRV